MPLLDHFHPPLSNRRHWEAFHAQWATAIATSLNESLPPEYFAEAQVHAGPKIEIDVASFQTEAPLGAGTITQVQPISTANLILPAVFPPQFSVEIFETSGGPRLVAAIELISPGNKDRLEARQTFAAKCQHYLSTGRSLITIDVVTSRQANLLHDLLATFYPSIQPPRVGPLLATSFRPTRTDDRDSIEVRYQPLELNHDLPKLPLFLGADVWLDVDFEETYSQARQQLRL